MLSIPQIIAVAANAGFTGNDLSTAVAIALAESSPPGNEQSYNPETAAKGGTPPGQGSYGLWQIYWKQHQNFDQQSLYDPQYNANAAYSIYAARGYSFIDWATYTGGQYLAFIPQVLAAIGSGTPTGPGDSGNGIDAASVTSDGGITSTLFSPTALLVEGIGLLLWFYLRG